MSSSRPSAPPGRAAAGRGTSLPVLSGVRVELAGDQLRLTGTDLELTISVEVAVSGEGDGVVVLPGPAGVRHRAGPAGRAASSRGRRRRGAHRRRPVRVQPAGAPGRRVPPPHRGRRASRSPWPAPSWPPRCRRWCGPRRATTPARSSPACSSPPRPAACASSPPTPTGWPIRDLPGTTVLAEGQHVLVPSRALQELARVLTGGDDAHRAPGRARRQLRGRRHAPHHRADRGRVPALRAADPAGPAQPAHRRPRGAARGRPPREAAGPRGHPGAARHVGRRPRAGRRHPGRRPGPREPRRQVRGHRAHRRVQPRVPGAGHRGRAGRRGHHRDRRRPQAGAPARSPSTPTSSTC